jgi:hypothetical protein
MRLYWVKLNQLGENKRRKTKSLRQTQSIQEADSYMIDYLKLIS